MGNYELCPHYDNCIIGNCNGTYRLEGRKAIARFSNGEHECAQIKVISHDEAEKKRLEGIPWLN